MTADISRRNGELSVGTVANAIGHRLVRIGTLRGIDQLRVEPGASEKMRATDSAIRSRI